MALSSIPSSSSNPKIHQSQPSNPLSPLYTPNKNPIFFLSHSFLIPPFILPTYKNLIFKNPIFKNPIFKNPIFFLTHSILNSSSQSSMATTSLNLLHLPRHQPATSLSSLATHLSASNFRQADEETRRLLISLAGEPAQKRGYVFFTEVQFISSADLLAIDNLWLSHSDNRLGYSVQRRVWDKSLRDFSKFFINVGWMRRLESEVEQFGYKSFPEEFMWELNDEMPDGHLPLTNALRGTQLLGNILMHPAFELEEIEEDEVKEKGDGFSSRRLMNTDYSF